MSDSGRANRLINTLEGHSDLVWSVAVSPDGARIVSGGADRTVKIWPMRHGRRIPHCLLRQRVVAAHATAHGDLDRQLTVHERRLYLERQLYNFVYGGCNDNDADDDEKLLPDGLFALFCEFLVG